MNRIESGSQVLPLREQDLELASAGYHEVDTPAQRWESPLAKYGFNPQPDPPGAPRGK